MMPLVRVPAAGWGGAVAVSTHGCRTRRLDKAGVARVCRPSVRVVVPGIAAGLAHGGERTGMMAEVRLDGSSDAEPVRYH
jgi:hypothetical protein